MVLAAALLLIPQGVGSLVSRFVVGKLVGRFGASAVTIATFLLAAVATVPFAFAGPHTSLLWLGAVLLVRGFGIGAVLIPPLSVAYYDIRQADIPHATMNTRIAQQVGASFGVATGSSCSPCSRTELPTRFTPRSGGRSASPSSPLSRPSRSPVFGHRKRTRQHPAAQRTMADVTTDPPRTPAASRNAGAAPAWKTPS